MIAALKREGYNEGKKEKAVNKKEDGDNVIHKKANGDTVVKAHGVCTYHGSVLISHSVYRIDSQIPGGHRRIFRRILPFHSADFVHAV